MPKAGGARPGRSAEGLSRVWPSPEEELSVGEGVSHAWALLEVVRESRGWEASDLSQAKGGPLTALEEAMKRQSDFWGGAQ